MAVCERFRHRGLVPAISTLLFSACHGGTLATGATEGPDGAVPADVLVEREADRPSIADADAARDQKIAPPDAADAPRSDTAPAALRQVTVGTPIPVEDNRGDTWAPAWAADGTVFTPSDDTNGFHNAGSANVAFHRLSGDSPSALTGTTVTMMPEYGAENQTGPDGATWKSTGSASIDGVLYWFVARHVYGESSGDPKARQTARNASLLKSTDGGKTWSRTVTENYDRPMFPGARFATPYFVDYGRDFNVVADGSDKYVYAVSNNGFWDNGDDQILGRVPRNKIGNLDAADWQFYTGGDGATDLSWSSNSNAAKKIVDTPGRLGMTGPAYLPAHHQYLMINWYYPAGGGKLDGAVLTTTWDFYLSPRPWGPWSKIASQTFNPEGFYTPLVCSKLTSGDGSRFYAFTAGNWTDARFYRLTLVPLDLK